VAELAVGRRWVIEALRAGRVRRLWLAEGARGLQEVLAAARAAQVTGEWLPRAELDRLAPDHQGVVAAVRPRPAVALETLLAAGDLLVAAAGVEDPRNLGAIARSAEAVGARGLILPRHRAAPVTPAAERAAAGAFEHLPVAVVTNLVRALAACQRAGLWACAADPDAELAFWDADLTVPLVVVVGGEGRGLPHLVRERCDLRVRLPMAGRVASLNAAVAAAVLLYEVARQRRAAAAASGRVDALSGPCL
jgi:23S rRNA (guanosine2251-2'-O)-methyltransferase